MTDTLVAFLKARLDDDERAATAPASAVWASPEWRFTEGDDGPFVDLGTTHLTEESGLNVAELEHIAHHAPARILREVAAKRQLINDYEESAADLDAQDAPDRDWVGRLDGLEAALRHLATAYADHPDHLEEWRP
ncbi:DUF6221 family protein [Streptomyces sp. NPDC057552]|uniref:DUF6221 family protein n=1 Tax=Streptomyces sp. NPDC057552 TaxID=3350537 RepID=UPI0036C063D2